jgi:hypothetical protein
MSMSIGLKPIVPDKLPILDVDGAKDHYARALNVVIEKADDDFAETTRTWKTKPSFVLRKASAANLKAVVYTTNEIYFYVVRGTRAHPIAAKSGGMLRFRAGYRAKTRPGVIRSYSGGGFGRSIYARQVRHPGTKARDFDKAIANRLKTALTTEMRLANKRIAQSTQR